jgi:uracil phosphoribosyltransferase
MAVSILNHPIAAVHLARLRDKHTPSPEFRRCLDALAGMLLFEATRSLETVESVVETPLCRTAGRELKQSIGLVPILRAGVAMVDAALALLPQAQVWHLGLYRDEETATPVHYYSKLPAVRPVDVAFVLDPMLATGGSALTALEALLGWGVRRLHLVAIIAARPGIDRVEARFPDVSIHAAAVDPDLNDRKFIVPGLGDAGDRAFHTG